MSYCSFMKRNDLKPKTAINTQAESLGSYINIIRNQQNITQHKLAEMMQASPKTLRRLESGDASVGLDICLAALIALGIEKDVLRLDALLYQSSQQRLPTIQAKQKIAFANKMAQQNIYPRMAKNAAWLLAFSPEKRIHILSRAVKKWQRTSLQKVKSLLQIIEKQHGRAMLIGDAAMFLYGKPNRQPNHTPDYEFWVRMAHDELIEIITSFGFEIERHRHHVLVAYDEDRKLSFLLSKRVYDQDQQLIEYDAVEAAAKSVSFEAYKLRIPNIKDMLKLKQRSDDLNPKDLEDMAYLTALHKVDP